MRHERERGMAERSFEGACVCVCKKQLLQGSFAYQYTTVPNNRAFPKCNRSDLFGNIL